MVSEFRAFKASGREIVTERMPEGCWFLSRGMGVRFGFRSNVSEK
jgi:hypothetical protein